MSAPTAISARESPMIKSSNGEKFAIWVFAFATKSVVKSVGNSIIPGGARIYTPLGLIALGLPSAALDEEYELIGDCKSNEYAYHRSE